MTGSSTLTATKKDENQLVTFFLGEEEFGFDIMLVQEIIRQPKLSKIPMAPPYVEGIANLRGIVLPVIDTRTRFGMARSDDTDRTRVLVVDVDGARTGLRVDRVRQVTRVHQNEVEPPPAVIRAGMSSDFLESVVKLENGKRIIMALNPRAICKINAEQAIANIPAEALANAETVRASLGADRSTTQLVTFKLGSEEFAFHMEKVREILRVSRPNELPDTPKHVLGVLTVRGNILPVIDLRLMLGMDTLESEVVADARHLADRFTSWLETTRHGLQKGSAPANLEGPNAVRDWISASKTSSETLMGIIGRMRTANEAVQRSAQALIEAGVAIQDGRLSTEIDASAQALLTALSDFQRSVRENIRDDQRLIVVQSHGTLISLLVDKVREVLRVGTSEIDRPPQSLSDTHTVELEGIAKLDSGKRLILLLNADRLLNASDLEKIGSGATTEGAGAAATEKTAAAAHDERQFVTFRLAEGEYGVPISNIQEIDRSSKMTRVPRTADYVDGITNLRGEVVSVINARKRFNLPTKAADERSRVIILEMGGVKTGLLVDSVREVLNLSTRDIAPPPASLSTTIDRQYISGIGKVQGDARMVVLLDVEKLLHR